MIDIDKAKKEFMKYVEKYDINNGKIRIKVKHILRVVEMSKLIAIDLNLDDEQTKLAQLIGIFHDIGRFEQVRVYNTFSDKDSGVDHAQYSLKVLYEDGLIKKFIDTDKYDDIIKVAVYNHNKAEIDKSLTGDALLFAKIIRDADKMDIYRVMNEDKMEDIFWYKDFKNLTMKKELMEKFKNEHFISYKYIENNADLILVFYGYIFDFNFNFCLRYIKNKKYLDSFYNRIKETFESEDINKDTKELLDICNNYIDEKVAKRT